MSQYTATLPLDLESLLAPIAMDRPAGDSLRYEGTYDRVQEARREDDPLLAQGVWKTRLKKADWAEVQQLCLDALETRSKDLQLAVWLLEAWLHLYGFAGVQQGITLLIGICESFWDTLHPQWDVENPEYRLAPLVWMNEKLSLQLKQLPLTHPQTGDAGVYSWADWESALRLEGVKDPKALQAAEAAGKVTQARFLGSVTLSPTAFYVTLAREVATLLETLATFERALEAHCGTKAPSLSRCKDVLLGVQHLVRNVLQERGEPGADTSSTAVTQEAAMVVHLHNEVQAALDIPAGGPIRSRAEAYRRLAEAADYLLRTEPHSPTPYLVKRAVSWGGMTLTDLLQEFVHNANDLRAIYALLGIRAKDPQ
jgi:type VI secretion system ImpA family protein